MKVWKTSLVVVLLGIWFSSALGADPRHEIHFPNLPGTQTLVCDFHMHTVFSDGQVWPTTRVDEAWRQGLDAISISDHIEYQPHRDDIPTKHNRPYDLALGHAHVHNLLLIKGTEITRDTPPGHFNAIFLKNVDPLDTPEFLDVIEEANKQGAFVFWNHQGWKGEEAGRWLPVHTTMFENKWLHGMEVCNGSTYYPSAHKWCLEKNLTMLGNSDIHVPDRREKSTSENHRTLTLVFVKEQTIDGVKEALQEGRTAVWFDDQIIGRQEILEPLFAASVRIEPPHVRTDRRIWFQIHNTCDADIHLERTGKLGPASLELPARTTILVKIDVKDPKSPLELPYRATNFLIAPEKGLPVVLKVPGVE